MERYRLNLCALFLYGMAFGTGISSLIAGSVIFGFTALVGGLIGGGYYLFQVIDYIEREAVEDNHAG